MARKRDYLLARHYLRLHLWLRHRCDRLTVRQRKAIVYGLSLVYLICSLWMIAQFFLPQREEVLPFPTSQIVDSPIRRMDSLYARPTDYIHHLAYNSNGK